jgi:AraC-like DNA-binding protein
VITRRRPRIAVAAATGLPEAIAATGHDPGTVLHSVGLPRDALADANGFIADADFAQLLNAAARVTGDDCFGLHLGEHYHPKSIGAVVYVTVNSPTIGAGLENVARYLRVHNEAATVEVVRGPQWTYLRHRLSHLPVDDGRQHEEYSLAVGLGTIRLMVGSSWSPVEVQFEHKAPAATPEHIRVFGAPVVFGCPTNAFVVEREFCERQVPAADARLYPILRTYLDGVLQDVPPEDDLLTTTRRKIAEAMRTGAPSLRQVAGSLAMGPRTLQRRLADHGFEFTRLVDDTRRRFSMRYLASPDNTLMDVAYLLGYSEVSAFNRAFKRWTGSTPSDYRRAQGWSG